jgi:hypothetical protein
MKGGENHCLSGASFSGENVQTWTKFEMGLFNDAEIANGNLF